jgi:hypothetical protein
LECEKHDVFLIQGAFQGRFRGKLPRSFLGKTLGKIPGKMALFKSATVVSTGRVRTFPAKLLLFFSRMSDCNTKYRESPDSPGKVAALLFATVVTVSGKDGDDAKEYQLREVRDVLHRAKER